MADQKGELCVTISWSQERSRQVAVALRDWLEDVAHRVDPWMSERDIEGGVRWSDDLAERLEVSPFGILCLTPENLSSPWVLFEAGAISKAHKNRVVPYLLGIKPSDVPPPLGLFNCVEANESGSKKLLEAINGQVPGGGLEDRLLNGLFDRNWPTLKARLDDLPPPVELVEVERPAADVLGEILEGVRLIVRRVDPEEANAKLLRDIADRVSLMSGEERAAVWRAAAGQRHSPITTKPMPIVVRGLGQKPVDTLADLPAKPEGSLSVSLQGHIQPNPNFLEERLLLALLTHYGQPPEGVTVRLGMRLGESLAELLPQLAEANYQLSFIGPWQVATGAGPDPQNLQMHMRTRIDFRLEKR